MVPLMDQESFVKSVSTSLNNKVISQYSSLSSPLVVDIVLNVVDLVKPDIMYSRDIRVVHKLGTLLMI